MKKVYLVIAAFALIACLQGIAALADGIAQRGVGGVNYGRVLFPLLIGGVCLRRYKRKK